MGRFEIDHVLRVFPPQKLTSAMDHGLIYGFAYCLDLKSDEDKLGVWD